MKLWLAGCRTFHCAGASKVYHFSKQSTGRIKNTKGGRTFAMKWGMTIEEFRRNYLKATANRERSSLAYPHASLKGRLRRAGYGLFKDYPLDDLRSWSETPADLFLSH
ncbi:MAG: hypothetical protein ACP5RC_03290 [Halothiobacillaceae bacterium]